MHVLYPKRRITQATSDPVTPARGGHAGARKRNGLARSVGLALVAMAIAVAVHGGDPPVRGQSGGSFLPKDTWPRVPNIQPADAWRQLGGMVVDGDGTLFATDADRLSPRVTARYADGRAEVLVTGVAACPPALPGRHPELCEPGYLALDAGRDRLYVADRLRHGVFVFDRQGAVLDFLKGVPAASGLAVGKDGTLFAASSLDGRLHRFDPEGRPLEVIVTGEGKPRHLVFSGDIGMYDRPVLCDPAPSPVEADVLLIESTYGDRLHRSLPETEDEIVAAFERTRAAKGNLIIPAFAVGRTQEIIYMLADLVRRKRLSPLKVYVDSPMANAATRITLANQDLLDPETRELIAWLKAHPKQMNLELVADVERSIALNDIRSGAVIISASGMCEAGRIKYHLRENLPRSECSILIAGFQAAGTLGRRLVDGARLVHIFGQPVPVRARIYTVGGLSAHADQSALLKWLGGFHSAPGHTFVVHGEAGASANFKRAIEGQLGWTDVQLPQPGEFVTL